jgi:hypothetical protein
VREGGGEVSDAEYKSDLRFLLFEYRNCRTEDAEEWYQTVEDIFKEKDARIAHLEALIADAPHSRIARDHQSIRHF